MFYINAQKSVSQVVSKRTFRSLQKVVDIIFKSFWPLTALEIRQALYCAVLKANETGGGFLRSFPQCSCKCSVMPQW